MGILGVRRGRLQFACTAICLCTALSGIAVGDGICDARHAARSSLGKVVGTGCDVGRAGMAMVCGVWLMARQSAVVGRVVAVAAMGRGRRGRRSGLIIVVVTRRAAIADVVLAA